jgi:hypothetical protein
MPVPPKNKSKKAFYFDVIHFLWFLVLLGSYPKFHCPYWYLENSPMFSSSFIISSCTFSYLIYFELISEHDEKQDIFQSSECGYLVFPELFIEEAIFAPMCACSAFVETQLDDHGCLFLESVFCSIGLCVGFYASTVLYFCCDGSDVCLETSQCNATRFVIFLHVCFGYLGSFVLLHQL